MMAETGGQMPDPEEMQEILQKARGGKKVKPPPYQALTMPLKMFVPMQVNDGFKFSIGLPFTQKFQSQLTWIFSNKKPADLEFMVMLLGGNPGPMMD